MASSHCNGPPSSAVSSSPSSPRPTQQPSLLVFSGGTAFNGMAEELKKLTTRVAHVLPVSDDGGSTAEIVRVVGGPAVGDIRSRCLRLSDEKTSEAIAVRRLLGHRLPLDSSEAKLEWYQIVEVVSTNDQLTLGCELWDGEIIRGQNEISHPSLGSVQNVNKNCSSTRELSSRIKRIFYMSSEGSNLIHEILPEVNSSVLEQLSTVNCIVYSMGSLFTSICPSLILLGIGETIASRTVPKVLLLNGSHDRETIGLSASGFVTAITDALNRTYGDHHNCLQNLPSDYINVMLAPKDGQVPVDVKRLAAQGIFNVVMVNSINDPKVGTVFEPRSLINALINLICPLKDPVEESVANTYSSEQSS